MSMDISITLSDADLEHFTADFKAAHQQADKLDEAAVIASARKAIADKPRDDLPDFIRSRLDRVSLLIDMVEDTGFALLGGERTNTLAALAYFANPNDAVPDNVPVLGYLDDAIMIELCIRALKFEAEAYEDFRDWRAVEAKRRGEDPAQLKVNRFEWAEARRVEAIQRIRRRRKDSYTKGNWVPPLFQFETRPEADSPFS